MSESSFSFDELQSANTVKLPDPETLTARRVQKPHPTENRAKKVANRPLLIPRMVFENGELWGDSIEKECSDRQSDALKHKRWFFYERGKRAGKLK